MSDSFNEIEQQARRLPADQRARWAQLLPKTLPGLEWAEFQDAWETKIEARVAADDSGEEKNYPAEDVFNEARSLCR
jgi:hypothetical protein